MSLSTYADLKTAAANWLKRSDLTSYLDDLVTVGETWIYRNVRATQMEQSLASQLTVASGEATLPSDWIAPKIVIYYSGSLDYVLEPLSAVDLYTKFPSRTEDVPAFYAIDGSKIVFGPGIPDSATVKGTYYQNLGLVSASAHALFTAHPDLYLFATLAEAAPFLKDDARVALWTAKRNEIAKDINSFATKYRYGDRISVRAS